MLDVLHQLAESEPVAPSRLRLGVPADLEAVCLKCLEKDPGRRYPTATELAADLGRFLAGQPTAARPASAANRIVRRVRRNPMLATFTLVTGLALAVGVAGITWQWQRAEQANADLKNALDAELAQRRVSEQLLYNATISQAVICWESGEVLKAREELSTAIPRAGREDFRGWEWYYLDRLFRPESAVLPCGHWVNGIAPLNESEFAVAIGLPRFNRFQTPSPADGRTGYLSWPADGAPATQLRPGPTPTAGVSGLAVDTVGKRVAWGTVGGRVVLSEANTQRVLHSWNLGADVTSVAFALGGKVLIAGSSDGSAWVIAVADDFNHPPVRHAVWTSWGCHVRATPDGNRVVCCGGLSGVRIYSIPDWNLQGEWGKSEGQMWATAFLPDGSLITGGANGRVAVWNGTNGKPIVAWEAHAGPIYALAVSKSGGVLASAGSDRVIRLWDPASGKPLRLLRGHTSSVRSLCFGTNPRSLASGGQDGTLRFWDTEHDPRGRVLPFPNSLNSASVAVEGDQMVVRAVALDGAIRTWAVTGVGETRQDASLKIVSQKHYPVAYTAFLKEGRLVAGIPADNPNTVAVWESATGREVFRAPPESDRILTLATDSRGRRIVWASSTTDGIGLRTWTPEDGSAPSAPTLIRAAFARAVATTTDGRSLAAVVRSRAGEPDTVWLRGPAGQSPASVAQGGKSSGGLAFSPGGEFLAASLDDDVQVFRSDTGEVVSTSAAVGSATCVAFSPDGRRMATVGYDSVVSLIMPQSGKVVFQLRGLAPRRHNDFASDARVVFSSDGQSLISTNWNGSINVWNATMLTEVRPSLMQK